MLSLPKSINCKIPWQLFVNLVLITTILALIIQTDSNYTENPTFYCVFMRLPLKSTFICFIFLIYLSLFLLVFMASITSDILSSSTMYDLFGLERDCERNSKEKGRSCNSTVFSWDDNGRTSKTVILAAALWKTSMSIDGRGFLFIGTIWGYCSGEH